MGRESWGALLALFVPVADDATRTVRQAPLGAGALDEAERELAALDDGSLQVLLDGSQPKES